MMNRRAFGQMLAVASVGHTVMRGWSQATPPPGPFQFSVMLWTLGKEVPLDRRLEIVAAAGYKGVEFTGEILTWTPDDQARAVAKIASLKLTVDSMDGGKFVLANPATSGAMVEPLKKRIALAKQIGCPQLILTPGKRMDGIGSDAMRTTIVDNLKRIADVAAKEDMQIVLEPIDLLESRGTASVYSVADGFEIVRAVGSPNVKVLYDFYHEQRSSGNLIEKLDKNIDLIGLVHIADAPGRHEPGSGEINYANIYRKLAQLHYDKYIAMEFNPTGDPVVTLKAARLAAIQAAGSATA